MDKDNISFSDKFSVVFLFIYQNFTFVLVTTITSIFVLYTIRYYLFAFILTIFPKMHFSLYLYVICAIYLPIISIITIINRWYLYIIYNIPFNIIEVISTICSRITIGNLTAYLCIIFMYKYCIIPFTLPYVLYILNEVYTLSISEYFYSYFTSFREYIFKHFFEKCENTYKCNYPWESKLNHFRRAKSVPIKDELRRCNLEYPWDAYRARERRSLPPGDEFYGSCL